MEIIVADRETIEAGLLVKAAYVVISITDPDKRKARIPKQSGLRGELLLSFHDAEPTERMKLPHDIKLMTENAARQVWQFVAKHRASVGAIVVHCEQGMSRSPAVAAAIAKHMGLDESRFWQEHQPNRYVYSLLCRTYPAVSPEPPAIPMTTKPPTVKSAAAKPGKVRAVTKKRKG